MFLARSAANAGFPLKASPGLQVTPLPLGEGCVKMKHMMMSRFIGYQFRWPCVARAVRVEIEVRLMQRFAAVGLNKPSVGSSPLLSTY